LKGSASELQDIYGDTAGFFEFLQDPNTGLTVFPILTIPMGGEYEGMGTAYTAVARDSSFFDANPAASALLTFTELSFLHNNWIADTNIEGIVFTRRRENWGYAFAGKFLYVPFTGYDIWGERISAGYYSETVAIGNISRNFLADYYFHGVSVGANLKTAYRHIPENIAAGQSAAGIMADFGVLTRFNFLKYFAARERNTSVGFTVKNVGPYALGEPLPMSATAGLAYAPLRPWIVAFDLNVPFSFDPGKYPPERPGFALGTSVNITNFFAVQSGFLFKGGNPRISLGSIIEIDSLAFVANYTIDMTTQFTNLDRFSIQVKVNLGDEGRKEKAIKVEEFYLLGIEAFAQGDINKAISLCEQALHLDPSYIPARETIITARRTLELQTEMEERQRIE
jgi:hypothetical protein